MNGLEALGLLKDFVKNDYEGVDKLFVEGSIGIIEKELKALRIFKKSCYMVPIRPFKEALLLIRDKEHCAPLTEEEFNLLKEVW